jgi:hypothetical protein
MAPEATLFFSPPVTRNRPYQFVGCAFPVLCGKIPVQDSNVDAANCLKQKGQTPRRLNS